MADRWRAKQAADVVPPPFMELGTKPHCGQGQGWESVRATGKLLLARILRCSRRAGASRTRDEANLVSRCLVTAGGQAVFGNPHGALCGRLVWHGEASCSHRVLPKPPMAFDPAPARRLASKYPVLMLAYGVPIPGHVIAKSRRPELSMLHKDDGVCGNLKRTSQRPRRTFPLRRLLLQSLTSFSLLLASMGDSPTTTSRKVAVSSWEPVLHTTVLTGLQAVPLSRWLKRCCAASPVCGHPTSQQPCCQGIANSSCPLPTMPFLAHNPPGLVTSPSVARNPKEGASPPLIGWASQHAAPLGAWE